MTLLHLVRKSAFETSDFQQCIDTLAFGDQVVLLDDGCYNMRHTLMNKLTEVMVIKLHADARAIRIKAGTLAISMEDLIELTFHHNSVVTWQ
tara:strand:+ start:779 stop:1054 length:276 start_codon:yes stop_codon:yes gene_type:complete